MYVQKIILDTLSKPHIAKVDSHNRLHKHKQYFVVLTKGYSQSIVKALSREGSTPCLSIYLP